MKKILSILALTLALTVSNKVSAQAVIQYPFGNATTTTESLTTKTTAAAMVVNNTVHYYNFGTHDTSLVLTATLATGVKTGALLYVKVLNAATAAARTITGSTGVTMASYTMTSAKTHFLTFTYDGSTFVNTGVIKVD